MSKGRDTKQGEMTPEGAGGHAEAERGALGGFGTGAGMRDVRWAAYEVEGTITGRWDGSVLKNAQPPSVRGVAYVNRETARKLLHGMVKEFRAHAARSEADGYMADADNFNRWAEQGEAVLGLTLGGG